MRTTLKDALLPNGTIKTGPFGTVLKADEYRGQGVPVISVGEIREGFFDVKPETPRVDETTTHRLSEYLLVPGDVVFARKGGIERNAHVGEAQAGWFLGSDGLRARPGSRVNGRFLAFQVRTPRISAWLHAHSTGSTMASLSQGILERLPIWLPPLPEQQAIAEVLGALDDKIAANRDLVNTTEALMVARVGTLEADATLTDIAELKKVQVTPDSMPPRVWHYSLPAYDEGALPRRESSTSIMSGKFVIDQPAVLLSKLNPRFPRIWDVAKVEGPAVASTEFLVLVPSGIPTSVLWALLSVPRVTDYLCEHAAGTSGSHQRVRPQEAMEVPMPQSVPDPVADCLATLGQTVSVLRRSSATLAELRDTLLPALMDGTLRVKDAERTVSEAL